MEEKLKTSNVKTSESENSLYRKYQELANQVHEKDVVIKRLETQLDKQVGSWQIRVQMSVSVREMQCCDPAGLSVFSAGLSPGSGG